MSDPPAPPPGFTLDDDEDAPAPPPGFSLDAPAASAAHAPVPVIEDDTFRRGDDPWPVRGMDAPELAQQGWNSEGLAVPVGEHSRNAFGDLIRGQMLARGPVQGSRYGRTVAPFDMGGSDLAEQFVPAGSALAAPSFVASDPEYRFDPMQAERLARLNGFGVYDYVMPSPAEYRANLSMCPSAKRYQCSSTLRPPTRECARRLRRNTSGCSTSCRTIAHR